VGESVGLLEGVVVGANVVQIFVSPSQRLLLQSLSTKQPSPNAHEGQLPPQSTSVSSPFKSPSMQVAVVGDGVGFSVGVLVGDAVGTAVG
jgi:hypothetical protein